MVRPFTSHPKHLASMVLNNSLNVLVASHARTQQATHSQAPLEANESASSRYVHF